MDRQAALRERIKQRINTKKAPVEKPAVSDFTESNWHFVHTLLAATPMLTAAIYLMGMAYHYGYVTTFGLDSTEFSFPADTTLLYGFISLIGLISPYRWWILGGFITLILGLFVMLFLPTVRLGTTRFWQRAWLRNGILWFAHKLRSRRFSFIVTCLDFVVRLYDKFFIVVMPVLLTMLAALYCVPDGAAQAKKEIAQLEKGDEPMSKLSNTSTMLGDTPHIRIICNTTHCAYRLKDGRTLVLRHDQIEQTFLPPKEPKKS
ncbi:cytochrome c biogenesis protein ResB [Aeromonas caviae]|nr:cytochrome c biogenesis protein ResB [Aeromonas caviae]